MKTVKFWGMDLKVVRDRYRDGGRTALVLYEIPDDPEQDPPAAIATVNVPDYHLGQDEVLIKDWSENEGMMEALEAAGIVEDTGRQVVCGYTGAKVARLKEGI